MNKTVAVVLHYENEEMTEQCVDSILETAPSVHILIVDNFSPAPYFAEKYLGKEKNIQIITNEP